MPVCLLQQALHVISSYTLNDYPTISMRNKANKSALRYRLVAKACLVYLLCFYAVQCSAQINFHKLFSIGGGSLVYPVMSGTRDGAAVIAFHRAGASALTLGLVKIDRSGTQVWTRAVAHTSSIIAPVSMAGTADSGVAIGFIDPIQMNRIELMKLDKAGNIQWVKSFSAQYYVGHPVPIYAMADGSILLAHSSGDSLCVKKFSVIGQMVLSKSYAPPGTGIIRPSAIVAHESSVYVGGYDAQTYSTFLIRTDDLGNMVWQKHNVGAVNSTLNIVPVQTGGIIISTATLNASPPQARVAFIRADGTTNWAIQIPYPQPRMFSVGPNAIGLSQLNNSIVHVAILDTFGAIKSSRSYRDSVLQGDYQVAGDPGRGLWVSGLSTGSNRVWLMRADTNGNSGCFTRTETLTVQNQPIQPLNFNLVGNVGTTASMSLTYTSSLLAVSDSSLCSTSAIAEIGPAELLCYPIPFTDKLIINQSGIGKDRRYRVLSTQGRVIAGGKFSENETVLNSAAWAPGLYFLIVDSQDGKQTTIKILKH